MDRDAHLVAKEVREGLVKDPSHYGVVLTPSDEVDTKATASLRQEMQAEQAKAAKELFNRGGTLQELRERCLQETGLVAPSPPSARRLHGPAAQLQSVRRLHARRIEEDTS